VGFAEIFKKCRDQFLVENFSNFWNFFRPVLVVSYLQMQLTKIP